jgi:hypothetical protein
VKPFPYVDCADAGRLITTTNIRAAVNPTANIVIVLIACPLCMFNSWLPSIRFRLICARSDWDTNREGKEQKEGWKHEKGMSVLEGFLRKKKPLDGGVNKSGTIMVFRRTAFGGQIWRQFLPGFLCARTIRLKRFDSPLSIAPSSEDFGFRYSIYRAIWMSASKPWTFQAQRRDWSEALASHHRHAGANHP